MDSVFMLVEAQKYEIKQLKEEMQEQSRIIGMSAEREAKLWAENERLKAQIEMLSTPHTDALDAQRIKDAARFRKAIELGFISPNMRQAIDILMEGE